MDNLGLNLWFLSAIFFLAAIINLCRAAKKKEKKKIKKILYRIEMAAKKKKACATQVEVFDDMTLGWDADKRILFYSRSDKSEVLSIQVSAHIPVCVNIKMDSGKINLISLNLTSVANVPYSIPFYDWFMDLNEIQDVAKKQALHWESKINSGL